MAIVFERLSKIFNALRPDGPNKARLLFFAFDGKTLFGVAKGPRPLDIAIKRRDRMEVQSLLNAGADPNLIGHFSGPALNEAVRILDIDLVRLLVKYKADVNQGNMAQSTPLHEAVFHCREEKDLEIIRLLLDLGADFLAKNALGDTPISIARHNRNKAAEQLIIERIDFLAGKKPPGPASGP